MLKGCSRFFFFFSYHTNTNIGAHIGIDTFAGTDSNITANIQYSLYRYTYTEVVVSRSEFIPLGRIDDKLTSALFPNLTDYGQCTALSGEGIGNLKVERQQPLIP